VFVLKGVILVGSVILVNELFLRIVMWGSGIIYAVFTMTIFTVFAISPGKKRELFLGRNFWISVVCSLIVLFCFTSIDCMVASELLTGSPHDPHVGTASYTGFIATYAFVGNILGVLSYAISYRLSYNDSKSRSDESVIHRQ
jgi:amino acid transporter